MDVNEMLKDIPEALQPATLMEQPNQHFTIYKDEEVVLKDNKGFQANAIGFLYFAWFPTLHVRLKCELLSSTIEIFKRFSELEPLDCYVKDLSLGSVYITSSSLTHSAFEAHFYGMCVTGDKSVHVQEIRFELPNFKDFLGENIKSHNTNYSGRMVLKGKKYLIHIDKRVNYKNLHDQLKNEGGYLTTHTGTLIKSNGSLSFTEGETILSRLSFFLSFVNGARVSPIFSSGFVNSELIWKNWSSYSNKQYKENFTWGIAHQEFNSLWNEFEALCQQPEDKKCIEHVIQSYFEANSADVFAETSIVIIHSALELLYNWLIVEKYRIIKDYGDKEITAANKIRLLLFLIKLPPNIPPSFAELIATVGTKMDAPEAFVGLRNSIVHSHEQKRKLMDSYSSAARKQVLDIGLWYTELLVLFILGYTGKYTNRCREAKWKGEGVERVPWVLNAR